MALVEIRCLDKPNEQLALIEDHNCEHQNFVMLLITKVEADNHVKINQVCDRLFTFRGVGENDKNAAYSIFRSDDGTLFPQPELLHKFLSKANQDIDEKPFVLDQLYK